MGKPRKIAPRANGKARARSKHRSLPVRYEKARQGATTAIALIPAENPDPSLDLIRAAFQQALLRAYESGDLANLHPLLLEAADRKRRELLLKEQTLALARERTNAYVQNLEARLNLMQYDLNKLSKPDAGKELTADDIRRIRAIHGLDNDPSPDLYNDPTWITHHHQT